MLLQLKGNTDPKKQFHLTSDAANVFLATGLAEEVLPAAKSAVVPAKSEWRAVQGALDGQYAPLVRYKCSTCNQSGFQESAKGTAHQTARFSHCGRTEHTPDIVAEKYLTLWRQYTDRTRRR